MVSKVDILSKLAHSEEAQGKASLRLSIRLNDPLFLKFEDLLHRTKLSGSDLCRGILVEIKNEILDKKNLKMRKDIQRVLRLAWWDLIASFDTIAVLTNL